MFLLSDIHFDVIYKQEYVKKKLLNSELKNILHEKK